MAVGGRAGRKRHWAAGWLRVLGALVLVAGLGPPAVVGGPGEAPDEVPAGTHEPLRLVDGRLLSGAGEGASAIADVTDYCLSCHDETAGADDDTATAHPADSEARDHPVDVAYPPADPDYRPPGELDPALVLLAGRITCVTCHAHDDPEHATALPTEGSEICRACHLM
jgi:hypothetical protein